MELGGDLPHGDGLLADVAEAYAAMDQRRATKAMLLP